jgi:hypothetical protein
LLQERRTLNIIRLRLVAALEGHLKSGVVPGALDLSCTRLKCRAITVKTAVARY